MSTTVRMAAACLLAAWALLTLGAPPAAAKPPTAPQDAVNRAFTKMIGLKTYHVVITTVQSKTTLDVANPDTVRATVPGGTTVLLIGSDMWITTHGRTMHFSGNAALNMNKKWLQAWALPVQAHYAVTKLIGPSPVKGADGYRLTARTKPGPYEDERLWIDRKSGYVVYAVTSAPKNLVLKYSAFNKPIVFVHP